VCKGWRPEGTATWQAANPLGKWMRRPGAQCQICWGQGYVLELSHFGVLMPVMCWSCDRRAKGNT
jgi:hypothetical protein